MRRRIKREFHRLDEVTVSAAHVPIEVRHPSPPDAAWKQLNWDRMWT